MIKTLILITTSLLFTLNAATLLNTGQTISYDVNGNEVTDESVMDDGFYEKGMQRDYSRNGDVVVDNVTGLEWQDDVIAKRTWLATGNDENYENYEKCEDNRTSPACFDTAGDTAATYCSTLDLDGGGWRVPDIKELETLLNYSEVNPSVTREVFENISADRYWSSSTDVSDAILGWYVKFNNSYANKSSKKDEYYVRCVRGEQLESSNLDSNINGVVTDNTTDLQWQDTEDVNTTARTWENAIDYCEILALNGQSNWRLPNQQELLSIVEYSRDYPSINTDIFQNTATSHYWSSTTSVDNTNIENTTYGWGVSFSNGITTPNRKENYSYVRCVHNLVVKDLAITPIINYLLF